MAEVREIGVVGAGFMGSGIAESAARAGLRVRVYEPSDAPLRLSKGRIEASVERAVRGGKMDEEQAAAVASPDEVRGNVVKAFIVLAEGHEPSDDLVKDIQRHVRERLSAYAYPRRIEFVDDLPKTLTGKIRRIELREREMEATKQ